MTAVQISLAFYRYLCQYIVGSEELVKIRRLLFNAKDNLVKREDIIYITSGSIGEGLDLRGSDVDLMFVNRNIKVHEEKCTVECLTPVCLTMDTEDTKPGFTKLRLSKIDKNCYTDLVHCFVKNGNDFYLSNHLFKTGFARSFRPGTVQMIHGPCVSDASGIFDFACCFHCAEWVSSVHEWPKRSHTSWPSNDVKLKVVHHGVLFVPIGSKGSKNEEMEWRISFSVAEKILIYSFNHTQLLCYALMKILLKDVINKNSRSKELLCSYYLKTIMFWRCEEVPSSEWRPDNLITCFMTCFARLIYYVEYSICPHYFIPENNMFENNVQVQQRCLLNNLYTLYNKGWQCLLLSDKFSSLRTVHTCTRRLLCNDVDHRTQAFLNDIKILLSSKTMLTLENLSTDVQKVLRIPCHSHSSRIKLLYLYCISKSAVRFRGKKLNKKESGNKVQYKYCKRSLCHLLLTLHHDAVSGWLQIASFFYQMKSYSKALTIIAYSQSKCTPKKLICGTKISDENTVLDVCRHFFTSKTIDINLMRVINVIFLDTVPVSADSSITPSELQYDHSNFIHSIPSIVYAHFLSFLCHYHLNNHLQCRDALRVLELTITEEYLISSNYLGSSYRCLWKAFDLFGDKKSAKQAYCKMLKLHYCMRSKFVSSKYKANEGSFV